MPQGRFDLALEAVLVFHLAVESDRILAGNQQPIADTHGLRKRTRRFSHFRTGNDGFRAAIGDSGRAQQNVGAQSGNVDARVGWKLIVGKNAVVNSLPRLAVAGPIFGARHKHKRAAQIAERQILHSQKSPDPAQRFRGLRLNRRRQGAVAVTVGRIDSRQKH